MNLKKTRCLLIVLLTFFISSITQAQSNQFPPNTLGVWGHGPDISKDIIKGMPFIRGWNFTFAWKSLEPEKNKFNWPRFDAQLKIAAENNLYIGFMVWVGQNSPEWVYTKDGVPKVQVVDNKHEWPYYPYYFSDAYKADYHHLLQSVFEHVKTLPPTVRNKILFWMSAEGSTGDEAPYKGPTKDPKYDISMDNWFEFKKGVWSYMYNEGQHMQPKLNILINQANNGMYLDWLLQNTPGAWFKAGSLAHTYSFNRELDYFNRLKQIVRPDNNGLTNRFRSESEEIQQLGWFKQSPQQNTFCLTVSALTIGLDMMNIRKNAVKEAEGDYSFRFFNQFAGQRDPATGAYCVLRDVLDVTDTKRFPEATYGKIFADNTSKRRANVDMRNLRQLRDVNPQRVQSIVKKFEAYGAQLQPSAEIDAKIYANDARLPAKLRKNNLRGDLQDKYNVDVGINLLPDNYNRFLTQYDPNGTSRGYWRIGPTNQPYGRYARGFDHASGMNEMWFTLDDHFFADNNTAHQLKVTIAYYDQGNGSWSFNYANAKGKTEQYRIQCKNTGKWVVKEVVLKDAYLNKKLEHGSDFSLKYLGNNDTMFSLVQVDRL